MNEIPPVDVDAEGFGLNLVMSQVFQDMMKRAERDADADGVSSDPAVPTLQATVARLMAQGATGFGR